MTPEEQLYKDFLEYEAQLNVHTVMVKDYITIIQAIKACFN